MSVICISNQKGGAGKTTLTHNLGCVLAQEFDKRILFVDADGQANLTTALGFDPDNQEKTMVQLLTEPQMNIKECVLSTFHSNMDLIPSSQQTFSAEKRLVEQSGREFILSDRLDPVREEYDFIFIDTPPTLGIITLNALIASHHIVFVYTASEFALDGLSQILDTLDEIRGNKRLNINGTSILGAIHNRHKTVTSTVNRKVNDALEGVEDIPRYFSPISEATEVEKAQFAHQPMIGYNRHHKVTQQFITFAEELIACLG